MMVKRLLLIVLPLVSGFHLQSSVHRRRLAFVRNQQLLASEGETNVVAEKESSESKELVDLPPVIRQIADERREFQMNLGKAMDVLRKDMPDILHRKPDFSIFDENISAVDPSGVHLTGLDKYKSAFAFFQTFVGFWFAKSSGLQYRMVYDFCRSSIRISWNAVLIPKVNPLGRPLYVDAISYYQLDRTSGKIVEHRIEKLMINNNPVTPPYGVFQLLQQDALGVRGRVPVGVGAMIGEGCYQ